MIVRRAALTRSGIDLPLESSSCRASTLAHDVIAECANAIGHLPRSRLTEILKFLHGQQRFGEIRYPLFQSTVGLTSPEDCLL